ncbi:alpha-L-rhamnosidase [Catenovulum agarivorans]|uniref:alpha-L-rhamnosidase n=1 Tax=Catenovulum agarivorans TaxID=1172192 RepID=UPI0002D76A7B|nr:alpha-L-rhamnosidase [Catenovulum agarivorans]
MFIRTTKLTTKCLRVIATYIALLLLSACSGNTPKETPLTITGLLTAPTALKVGEGFVEPLGYYEKSPRFSWQLADTFKGKNQSAYQVQVVTDKSLFNLNADLWDSGKIHSQETSWIKYQGKTLNSRQIVYWRVRAWNEQDQVSTWSQTQSIELGLLSNNAWQAKWIGHPDTELHQSPTQSALAASQYLRKSFTLAGEVKQARLYISAKGLFKPFINGKTVSQQDVMTPGWTPYQKRIESLTYDVTQSLNQGENVLAAAISGGWYAGRVYKFTDKEHRLPARLLAQLEVTYTDGSREAIVSDESWQVSMHGPIRFSSIYDGEHYDQHFEMPGWTSTQFNRIDDNWQAASATALDSNVAIVPKRHTPVRNVQTLPVKDIVKNEPGKVIFDFGQNMAGVPKLSIPALAGQNIKVRFAEALHKGEFYTDNYRSAKSELTFTPSKTGIIEYQPTFTYFGYRYIEISGFDQSKSPNKNWATAIVQHSDVNIHANFASSHKKLNQLTQNIIWGLKSNFYDIPLDCPQRDERLGWTGDAQVFVTPSMYMADVYGFWSAWLESVREEQSADGKVPVYIPFVDWINFASSGWGDAVTIIPWELYMVSGDKTILADNYAMMKKWVNYHQLQSENYISKMKTFGDWLQPYPNNSGDGENGSRGDTNFELIGTAYFAHSLALTIKAAKVLNKDKDVQDLTELHSKVKHAFYHHFFEQNLNLKLENAIPTQTTYLLGLAYQLFPENKRALALDKLIELLKQADNHLRTGFLGTPLLTKVLQEAGRSDIIYQLIFKETYPSWFYSINNGATTTWERWNSYTEKDGFNAMGMNSLNHYAYGTISRWFYEGILGITPAQPGFKHIRIEPQLGKQLSNAKGGYLTPHGEVNVAWAIEGQDFTMKVVIPKNTTADIVLPDLSANSLILNGKPEAASAMLNLAPGEYRVKARLVY